MKHTLMILQKLDWYKKGNHVSNNQWNDIQGMLKIRAEQLDFDYMNTWAKDATSLRALGKGL